MDLEKEAEKELERVNQIVENLELLDSKGIELYKVLQSYCTDAKSFFKKNQFLQSLEASFIVWAYVDAGLHLKVFKVPKELDKMFTV